MTKFKLDDVVILTDLKQLVNNIVPDKFPQFPTSLSEKDDVGYIHAIGEDEDQQYYCVAFPTRNRIRVVGETGIALKEE